MPPINRPEAARIEEFGAQPFRRWRDPSRQDRRQSARPRSRCAFTSRPGGDRRLNPVQAAWRDGTPSSASSGTAAIQPVRFRDHGLSPQFRCCCPVSPSAATASPARTTSTTINRRRRSRRPWCRPQNTVTGPPICRRDRDHRTRAGLPVRSSDAGPWAIGQPGRSGASRPRSRRPGCTSRRRRSAARVGRGGGLSAVSSHGGRRVGAPCHREPPGPHRTTAGRPPGGRLGTLIVRALHRASELRIRHRRPQIDCAARWRRRRDSCPRRCR